MRRWGQPSAKGQHLEVVETVALGPGKSLSLVAVGNKSFLLAATNDRISLVSELQESDLKIEVDLLANDPDNIAGFNCGWFQDARFQYRRPKYRRQGLSGCPDARGLFALFSCSPVEAPPAPLQFSRGYWEDMIGPTA